MNLQSLKSKIKSGQIDTVVVAFPDVCGRLVGKRFTGRNFLDQVLKHGTHACNYLLTVDIEMEPMEGFNLANWEKARGAAYARPLKGQRSARSFVKTMRSRPGPA